MIAMQYKITLPADYPMDTIKERITSKGHLLNEFPGLVFKAFLYSEKSAQNYENPINSYAPFYVWKDHQSMIAFLKCDGFKALCEQFARPQVDVWFVDGEIIAPNSIEQFASIGAHHSHNADINAMNYTTWKKLSIKWISQAEAKNAENTEVYAIGYIAKGKA